MEQRPLRLGDIVDDYCPRERRITNHAIVVMSGDDIQQTRCAACDAEHPYKHAKAPLKKKKDGALYDEVLAGVLKPKAAVQDPPPAVVTENTREAADVHAEETAAVAVAVAEPPPPAEPEPVTGAWGHRPLIRAQLPRIEGQTPASPRPLPEFTIRQQGSRGYGQPNHNGSRRGQGSGQNQNNQFRGHGNGGQGGGFSRRDRSQGRSRPR
jgi:hypothetical protein